MMWMGLLVDFLLRQAGCLLILHPEMWWQIQKWPLQRRVFEVSQEWQAVGLNISEVNLKSNNSN